MVGRADEANTRVTQVRVCVMINTGVTRTSLYVVMVSNASAKIADICSNGSIMPPQEPSLNRRSGHSLERRPRVRLSQLKVHAEIDRFRHLICGGHETEKYSLEVSLDWNSGFEPSLAGLRAQAFKVVFGDVDLPASGAAVVSPAITLMQIWPTRRHRRASPSLRPGHVSARGGTTVGRPRTGRRAEGKPQIVRVPAIRVHH